MTGEAEETSIDLLTRWDTKIWIIALVFFGMGDYLTTVLGLYTGRVVEVGPIAALVVQYGLIPLAILKIASILLLYALWTVIPEPHNVGVPLALAVLGILVTGWNTGIIIIVLT